MKYTIYSLHGSTHTLFVGHIPLRNRHPQFAKRFGFCGSAHTRDDFVVLCNQLADHMASDEAGCPGNKVLHDSFLLLSTYPCPVLQFALYMTPFITCHFSEQRGSIATSEFCS